MIHNNATFLLLYNNTLGKQEYILNTTENTTDTPHSFNIVSLIFCCLFAFTFIFGLLTNLLVVIVFLFKSELRQYTNYFFTNLSIADLLVIIICIPVAISDLYSPDVWNFGMLYCKMFYYIEYCVTTVSSLTIIFISLERYCAISKPLLVKIWFNEKNSLITILLIWVVAIMVSSPFLIQAEYTAKPIEQCILDISQPFLIYIIISNILLIFIPTFGLAFLYIYIIINLRKHYKLFNQSTQNENENGLRIHSKNSIRMYKTNITTVKNKNRILQEFSKSSSISGSEGYKSLRTISPAVRNFSNHKASNSLIIESNRNSFFKWNKKRSRSCSFCFSGINNKYECRCDIGNQTQVRNMYLNKKNVPCPIDASNIAQYSKITKFNSLNNFTQNELIRNQSRTETSYNKVNFTIVISLITLIFFCCQLPIRIFLLWSYFKQYLAPSLITTNESTDSVPNDFNVINIISNLATLIYFLHCISNPIIYNLLSIKFRRAFLSLGISHKPCLFKLSCKTTCLNK